MTDQTFYAIYSANEAAASDDAGFWNQEDGWTVRENATRFSSHEILGLKLPASLGQDAAWVRVTGAMVAPVF